MDAAELEGIGDFRRSELVDASGRTFRSQRRLWTPRFGIVWLHILAGHVALVALGVFCWLQFGGAMAVVQVVVGAVGFGYVHAYLQLFLHEAAHYNLAPDRRINDRLANLVIGAWVGVGIEAYRPTHLDHHRHLGTTRDTERSYFNALDLRLILESITGVHVLRVLTGRKRDPEPTGTSSKAPLIQAVVMHAAILLVAFWAGRYVLMIAWVMGIATFFPFFMTIRQLMEHRSLTASSDVDYAEVDHGVVNRMFGTGPLASTLGGAGFNRHLLHHWEPQVSYTRLGEMERFLMATPMAAVLDANRTSYTKTFVGLLRAP